MNKKILIYVGIGVVVLLIIYFIYNSRKGTSYNTSIKNGSSTIQSPESGIAVTSPTSPIVATSFPLKEGMRGDKVLKLQQALNKLYDARLQEDGIFGPLTAAALKDSPIDANFITLEQYESLLREAGEDSASVSEYFGAWWNSWSMI